MNVSTENLYSCATILLASFVGAIVRELYESGKDGEEKPINIKMAIAGGMTGAVCLNIISFVSRLEFNWLVFYSFFTGMFGYKILSCVENITLVDFIKIAFINKLKDLEGLITLLENKDTKKEK